MESFVKVSLAASRARNRDLFVRVFRSIALHNRIALYSLLGLATVAFITMLSQSQDDLLFVFSAFTNVLSIVVAGILFIRAKTMVFESFREDFEVEFPYFEGKWEFFRFLLFLENLVKEGVFSREHISSALDVVGAEIDSKRPSYLTSTPFFAIVAAIWAGSFVGGLDSDVPNFSELLIILLIFISIVFCNYALAIVSPHKSNLRLQKFCRWNLSLSQEKFERVKAVAQSSIEGSQVSGVDFFETPNVERDVEKE